jgi:predicted DNA-binding WGR domain protein
MLLTRTDASCNLHRFYVVQLTPTLFGEWTLMREWGRIGSPGTVRATSFERQADAERAEQHTIKRRLNHGYRIGTRNRQLA